MANTYTQCYVHLVFSPKNRQALISEVWKDELEKYITGIIQNRNHKLLAIGSMPDHIHMLIGYNINDLIPDLVENIKTSTNAWIKEKRLSKFKFEWQHGYGAFTHSRMQMVFRCSALQRFRCSAPLDRGLLNLLQRFAVRCTFICILITLPVFVLAKTELIN